MVLCTQLHGDSLLSGTPAEVARAYGSVGPFRPGNYVLGSGGTAELMVAITPSIPGMVDLAGFRVRYHMGARHGSEQSGIDVVATSRRGTKAP